MIGAGFIGGHLVEALQADGAAPRVLSRSPLARETRQRLAGADIVVGDAAIRPVVEAALEGVGHVFFCAGGLMPAESNLDPATDAALALPPLISLLTALRQAPDIGMTFLSSGGTVYGDPTVVPVSEDHRTEPYTSYGVMKLASEKYVLMYRRLYGLSVRILRCANVYGEFQPAARGQGLIAAVLDRASRGEPVVLFGDGLNVRDFVYVKDVAAAMRALAGTADGPDVLNVGSGAGSTLQDIIDIAEKVTQRSIAVERRPDRGFDVREIVLDISALQATIPFTPTSLEDGVAATWRSLAD